MVNLLDNSDSCWGCGVMGKGIIKMSQSLWHKILYVAVHLGFLDLSFTFQPFDSPALWIEGTVDCLEYLGFGEEFKNKVLCFYFDDCFSQSGATNDPHWLVNCIQFS